MDVLKLQPCSTFATGIPSFTSAPTVSRRSNHVSLVRLVRAYEKSIEVMRKFSEQCARKSGTYFCLDKSVTSVVIKGLAEHKDSFGAPLCPCWKECHCMLFLTPENDFAGNDQTISLEEIRETTAKM